MAQRVRVALQPVYSPDHGKSGPVCALLRVDESTILLDCGWEPGMSETRLEPLRR